MSTTEQTVDVEDLLGGVGQLELWTEWQWQTSREKAGQFPF